MQRPKVAIAMTVLAAMASMGQAGPAVADAPLHVSIPVDVAFQDVDLTAECGVTVLVEAAGTFDATLHVDPQHVRALEIDHQVLHWTYSSPTTGRSFEYVNEFTAFFSYPDGPVVGGPATITVVGTLEHIPGGPATAGQLVFESTISQISPEGFPIAFLDEPPVSERGSFPETDICAALR